MKRQDLLKTNATSTQPRVYLHRGNNRMQRRHYFRKPHGVNALHRDRLSKRALRLHECDFWPYNQFRGKESEQYRGSATYTLMYRPWWRRA